MTRRLFLADVHCGPDHPERARWLIDMLRAETPHADELYLLGDIFDYWVGPKQLRDPDCRPVLDALRAVVAGGTRVTMVKGNRDFYLRGFGAATGVQVAPHGTWHEVPSESGPVYLAHGDYLEARGDPGFRLQEFFRGRAVEALYTRLPYWASRAGARFYRGVSARRAEDPARRARHVGLDEARLRAVYARGVDVIVCGHVHHAAICNRRSAEPGRLLVTLGAWFDGPTWAVEESGHWRIEPRPSAQHEADQPASG